MRAEEASETPAAVAETASPSRETAQPADAESTAPEDDSFRERTIYIPYDKLREVFEREGRGVYLPYEEFRALWEAARGEPEVTPEPESPYGALINEVRNDASIETDVVRVKSQLSITLLHKGWLTVPVRLGDAAIVSATCEGKPARLISQQDGYALLLEHKTKEPQDVTVEIEFAKAITRSPGKNAVSFQVPQAPIARWTVHIAQPGIKMQITPILAATEAPEKPESPETPSDASVLLAFVGATPTVTLEWTPKAEGAAGLEALVSVETKTQMVMAEGVVRTRAEFDYTIRRAAVDKLDVAVPADQKIVSVFDPNIRQWSVQPSEKEGDPQVLSIVLFDPATQSQHLTIELEKILDRQSEVSLPVLEARGVVRQQGIVVVGTEQGLRAEVVDRKGLLQIDTNEVPQSLKEGNWKFGYRYVALPIEATFRLEKVQPLVHAKSWAAVDIGTTTYSFTGLTQFDVQRAGVFQLALEVPPEIPVKVLNVRGADVGGTPVQVERVVRDPDDPNRVLIDLSRQAFGKVGLQYQYSVAFDSKRELQEVGRKIELTPAISRPDDASVESNEGAVVVRAASSLLCVPKQVRNLRPVSPEEAYEGLQGDRAGLITSPGRNVLIQAFAWAQESPTVTYTLERRKPQVEVRHLLTVAVEDRAIRYTDEFRFDVQYGGVESFRIDIPEVLADEFRLTTRNFREERITPDPDDLEPGYQAWKFSGPQELLGSYTLTLTWTRELSNELDKARDVPVDVPRLIPRNVEQSWGQVVVLKAENIDVRDAPGAEGVRPIDPQHDLMDGLQFENAAGAFEFHGPWTLQLLATRYQVHPGKPTGIERGFVRVVVTRSGTMSVQAIYRLRSVQQRLAVELPEGAVLDAEQRLNGNRFHPETTIDETEPNAAASEAADAVTTEAESAAAPAETPDDGRTRRRYYVPLVGTEPGEPVVLELRYTLPGDGSEIPLPTFPIDSDVQPQAPAVQKIYLGMYLPEEICLFSHNGTWTEEFTWSRLRLDLRAMPAVNDSDLLEWASEGVSVGTFPTDGTFYVFSAVDPRDTPEQRLRLTLVDNRVLHLIVAGCALLIGIVLLPFGWRTRTLAITGLVVAWIVMWIVAPIPAQQIVGKGMAAGAVIVVIVWGLQWARRLFQIVSRWKPPLPPRDGEQSDVPPQAPDGDHGVTEAELVEPERDVEPVVDAVPTDEEDTPLSDDDILLEPDFDEEDDSSGDIVLGDPSEADDDEPAAGDEHADDEEQEGDRHA
ncbi:hypothetical protein [Thermostilla marina]